MLKPAVGAVACFDNNVDPAIGAIFRRADFERSDAKRPETDHKQSTGKQRNHELCNYELCNYELCDYELCNYEHCNHNQCPHDGCSDIGGGSDVRVVMEAHCRRAAHVPRQPEPSVLRRGAGAERTCGGVDVSEERRYVSVVVGEG